MNDAKKIKFINELEVYNDHDILLREYNKLKGINSSSNNNNNNKDEEVNGNQSNQ
jgi:hypothetical protein